MKAIPEHHRLRPAKIERSYFAVLVLVALVAFILGMVLGSRSGMDSHGSRIEWPQPHPRALSP